MGAHVQDWWRLKSHNCVEQTIGNGIPEHVSVHRKTIHMLYSRDTKSFAQDSPFAAVLNQILRCRRLDYVNKGCSAAHVSSPPLGQENWQRIRNRHHGKAASPKDSAVAD